MSIRRRCAALAVMLAGLALAGCEAGGHFTFLGYTTRPNYDPCIRTVCVPIFECTIMLDETRRQIPFDLTKAVVREIEAKTPYKVISDRNRADTVLTGKIVSLAKNLVNRNQENEIREAETVMTVGIVWKDLRSGEYLSKNRKAPFVLATPGIPALDIPELNRATQPPVIPPPIPGTPEALQGAPGAPPPSPGALPATPPNPDDAARVMVTGLGDYIPELGQSTTTAYQQMINKLAIQIVSIMEKPW
jgi:hypothetical protein